MNDAELIIALNVMSAALNGKAIEFRAKYACGGPRNWSETSKPTWNWSEYDYRVKPEPLRFWCWVYDGIRSDDPHTNRGWDAKVVVSGKPPADNSSLTRTALKACGPGRWVEMQEIVSDA